MADEVLFEQRDNVGILTLNVPKANQLSHEVFEQMRKFLDANETDRNVRALVVTATGDKIFCAGADLSNGFGDFGPVDYLKRGQDIFNKIEDYPKPVIAAVNGHALGGGCELALACHFRFLKKGSRIGLTETNLGIMPGYGGTLRLQRIVGRSRALKSMILGTPYGDKEALELHIVDRLCEEDETLNDSIAFANELAQRPPLAVKAILKIMSASYHISPEQHLKMEREELAKLFSTKDMTEGMTAFMQKRPPAFTGE